MTKIQKIWMWIFIAMFAVPEILLFTSGSSLFSLLNNFSGTNIKAPIYFFVNQQFFTDHPIYPLSIMAIEWIGVLGLIIGSIASSKKILTILLGAILVWLSFLIFVGYTFGESMSFF